MLMYILYMTEHNALLVEFRAQIVKLLMIPISRGHAFQMWALALWIMLNWDVKSMAGIVCWVCWWQQNSRNRPELRNADKIQSHWIVFQSSIPNLSIYSCQTKKWATSRTNGLLEDFKLIFLRCQGEKLRFNI